MDKNIQKILDGKKKMVAVRAVTIQQDKDGTVLISASEGVTLAMLLDMLMLAMFQTWNAIKAAPPASPIVSPTADDIKKVVS